jgi:RNA polymerase sigma-70 factor (ECF subfamily)
VARGERAAFRELVERYQAPLHSFVLRMVRRPSVAEELVQETFVRAYRAAARFRPEAAVSTWLFHIAARLAMNEAARAHNRRELAVEPPDMPSAKPGPQEALEQKELAAAVEAALAQLPPKQRAAVVLARFEGMSYREIAQVLEVSEGAVDGLLQRARLALSKVLRPFV